MAKFQKLAQGAFWIFFTVFLMSSVPHIATWFRHFDGTMTTPLEDTIYWVLAYGKAIAIDGADILLTLALLRQMEQERRDYVRMGLMLLFIGGLTLFSWYINWQYAVQFQTREFAQADQQVSWLGVVGGTNPLIGSAFQLFGLVFVSVADTLLKQRRIQSIEELQKEAEDMRVRADLEQQIAEIRGRHRAAKIADLASTIKTIKRQFGDTVGTIQPHDGDTQNDPDGDTVGTNGDTQNAVDGDTAGTNGDTQNGPDTDELETIQTHDGDTQNFSLDGIRGRTVDLLAASKMLGIDAKYLRKLRDRGTIKTSSRNRDRLLVASLKEYLEKRNARHLAPVKTQELEA